MEFTTSCNEWWQIGSLWYTLKKVQDIWSKYIQKPNRQKSIVWIQNTWLWNKQIIWCQRILKNFGKMKSNEHRECNFLLTQIVQAQFYTAIGCGVHDERYDSIKCGNNNTFIDVNKKILAFFIHEFQRKMQIFFKVAYLEQKWGIMTQQCCWFILLQG